MTSVSAYGNDARYALCSSWVASWFRAEVQFGPFFPSLPLRRIGTAKAENDAQQRRNTDGTKELPPVRQCVQWH